jgi:hypothetical protein
VILNITVKNGFTEGELGELEALLQNKRPKAAWTMVCKSKKEGGLGVLDLKTQNEALLLKHLMKFFNREDIPWVALVWESYYEAGSLPSSSSKKGSFWWRDILKLTDKFKGLAAVNINNARSCYLWTDLWNSKVPMQAYLELFSFVKSSSTILAEAISRENILDFFNLPLSQQAFLQLNQLQQDFHQLALNEQSDSWTCIWNSGKFSVARAYKQLSGHRTIHKSFKWVWNSSCQNKHKVFAWLFLKDRLSTRELLKRKNIELQDYSCVLCSSLTEEYLLHLMVQCPFASTCWNWIGLQVSDQQDLFQNLESLRRQLQVPFYMEIIILMCWAIWHVRNGLIFNNRLPTINEAKRLFKSEMVLLLVRARRSYFPWIELWINNLV